MLVIQRRSSILPAIENDHVLASQSRQRKPSSLEIVRVQKLILVLELDGVQDHLRPDSTVLVQDQFVARAEQPEREILAVACECWRSFLGACSPGFSGQAVSHVELKLGRVSSNGCSSGSLVDWYIKWTGRNIARSGILPDDFSLLYELVKPRQHEFAELHVPGYCHYVMVELGGAKAFMQVIIVADRWYLHYYISRCLTLTFIPRKYTAYVIRGYAGVHMQTCGER